MSTDKLESEVLKLPPKDRLRVATKIVESLDELSEQESRQLWVDEALRRDAELDENPDLGIPSSEVFREVRSRFK